ncbi:MAG: DUF1320 domain-containing protein [Betaproteobacteria bacterium]|nr:DUF1320 domain-containing protein [Betaproteobacteria bacterium]
MGYCAQADLEARFGAEELKQLTDETNVPPATIEVAEVANACAEASSLIDGYLRSRYTLPLSTIPDVLKKWACDIARFYLWDDRAGEGTPVRAAYDDALKQLEAVAKGTFALVTSAGADVSQGTGSIAISTSDRVFTDDLLSLMP